MHNFIFMSIVGEIGKNVANFIANFELIIFEQSKKILYEVWML